MKGQRSSPLRAWWWRQQFEPGGAAILVAPFFFARRGLIAALREFFPQLQGEVLDVGCGRMPYRHLVPAARYVGVDVDSPVTRQLAMAEAFYDGTTLPYADSSFDGLLCSQVFEHVFHPDDFLRELHRVLRPGGRLVLTVPFAWDEHEQPHDFARYSSFGVRAVLEKAGFAVREQRKSCADFRALVQLASGWVFKTTRTRSQVLNLAAQLGLIAPVNLFGGVLAWILPANPDFYLDNIVLAEKPARESAR